MGNAHDRGFYRLVYGPVGVSAGCKFCRFTASRKREPGNGWQGRAAGEVHRDVLAHAEAAHPEAMAKWHAEQSAIRRRQIAERKAIYGRPSGAAAREER